MALRDQDLRYLVRVQDAQLKALQKEIRTLNRELQQTERAAGIAGTSSTTAFQRGGRGAKEAHSSTTAWGHSLKDIAKTSVAVGAGFLAVRSGEQILHDSVDAAETYHQQLKKVEDVLGDVESHDLERWANGLADSLGLAGDQALRFAAGFATTFKVVGFGDQQAAEMSRRMVELAADMAAFNQVPVEATLSGIQKGLTGMTRGLKPYGVLLDNAAVNQLALEQTGKKATSELTRQEKVMARYQLILKDADPQVGAFARRSDDLAGESKKLKAELRNLERELGDLLIPVLTAAAHDANLLFQGLHKLAELGHIVIHVDTVFEQDLGLPHIPTGKELVQKLDIPEKAPWAKWFVGPAFGGPEKNFFGNWSQEAEDAGKDLRDAIERNAAAASTALGKDLEDALKHVQTSMRDRLLKALDDVEDKALRVFDHASDRWLDQFDDTTDAWTEAFDKATETMLSSFDERTQKMLEGAKAIVRVGAEQFTIGEGQLTPAERELAALEKIDSLRKAQRAEFDARKNLGQAMLIGDPEQIRQAKRDLQDAEAERKRLQLGEHAKTERKAADKALDARRDEIAKQRALERDALEESREHKRQAYEDERADLRKAYAERREIVRDNLQKELAAQREALEKGKKQAGAAQQAILKTLRSFGVDYKGVGAELGGQFMAGWLGAVEEAWNKKAKAQRKADEKRVRELPPGVVDPVTGGFVDPLTGTVYIPKRKGHALGGVADGPAGRDAIPAWLTRGEMVLTDPDQRRLARMLGMRSTGWPLLGKIRTGYAEGGVVDDDEYQRLLARFSKELSRDAVHRGTGLASAALLKGGMSEAERKALLPVHIQSLVKHSLGAKYANLDRGTKLKLLGELAQRQAHPVRAGLLKVGPTGYAPGAGGHDPGGGRQIPASAFTVGDIHVNGGHQPWETARMVRQELQRLAQRAPMRRRGRNYVTGTRLGLS